MIALDTNILVYAHREDSPHHTAALRVIQELTDAPGVFGIPWPCVSEFLAVTTHPRIYDPPSLLDVALDAIEQLTSLPKALLLGETSDYLRTLRGFGGPGMTGASLPGSRRHRTADRGSRLLALPQSENPEPAHANLDLSAFARVRVLLCRGAGSMYRIALEAFLFI